MPTRRRLIVGLGGVFALTGCQGEPNGDPNADFHGLVSAGEGVPQKSLNQKIALEKGDVIRIKLERGYWSVEGPEGETLARGSSGKVNKGTEYAEYVNLAIQFVAERKGKYTLNLDAAASDQAEYSVYIMRDSETES